uniref:Transposase Tnp1/En/Spm-like domain-containing protein n=1 Tax=Fagus sylvatica TaxID=28930 RepID=A0A2N9EGZ8_FAGSY
MPNIGIRKWKKVADSIKQLMYQCVKDKFDLQGDSVDVNKSLNTKFANSLRQHVYRLHTKYKKAKLTHGDEYVRNHPPENVTTENWIELIDKKWTDSDFKEEMLRLEEEHLVDPDAIPLTPEEVSVRVLKPRSGYVKGLGIRPSSSLRTIASSGMSRDDVQRQIAEIKEAANSEIAELKEANKRHEEANKMHEEMIANILEFLSS